MSITESSAARLLEKESRERGETASKSDQYLISKWVDFWCLGGLTLVLAPIVVLMPNASLPAIAFLGVMLAHWINNPHFAHSYQIFYRAFAARVADPQTPTVFRFRYVFAGVVVPVLLAVFLTVNLLRGDLKTLGYAGNLMVILVGWHYVKQGYGMLIVQSVLKRWFFTESEKKILILNAYACWIAAWCMLTYTLSGRNLFGVEYYVIPIDVRFVYLTGAMFVVTTLVTAIMLLSKIYRQGGNVPVTGIMAYLVTLYVWMFAAFMPALIFITPALHSLQYLVVVWRFEANYQEHQKDSSAGLKSVFGDSPKRRFIRFIGLGIGLGYLGFWFLPETLAARSDLQFSLATSTVFLFVFWIFINVHHYFLDNVMWRKENPETGKYLFARRS